ncbi:MAG: RMD1 family protein [Proteobacteria bacterium]|nr:RMD1 family protein [Pseudomonadota bacterium]
MTYPCTSYCSADAYDFEGLVATLRAKGLEPEFCDDALHLHIGSEADTGHIYIFPYGSVVFWGVTPEQTQIHLALIHTHAIKPLETFVSDTCVYRFGKETHIIEEEDEVILGSKDPFLMLSFSYGMSQSVKLAVFENTTTKTIQKSKDLPEELAQKGAIRMSRQKLSKKIGALFAERHSINLHSDLLDTPEFFWKRPSYEAYYHMCASYLDITTRTSILNQRLSVLHELYGMLSDELKHLHSSRLEWIIILLIVMEVVMSILDFTHKG